MALRQGSILPFVQLRREFESAVADADEAAADRLCVACVELLNVDGASISLWRDRGTWGRFGSSGEIGRRLDEFQFTFGEGPCLDAMTHASPVLIPDLSQGAGERWPRQEKGLRRADSVGACLQAIQGFIVGRALCPPSGFPKTWRTQRSAPQFRNRLQAGASATLGERYPGAV